MKLMELCGLRTLKVPKENSSIAGATLVEKTAVSYQHQQNRESISKDSLTQQVGHERKSQKSWCLLPSLELV